MKKARLARGKWVDSFFCLRPVPGKTITRGFPRARASPAKGAEVCFFKSTSLPEANGITGSTAQLGSHIFEKPLPHWWSRLGTQHEIFDPPYHANYPVTDAYFLIRATRSTAHAHICTFWR